MSLDTYNSDLSVSINPENERFYNEEFASLHYMDQEDDHGTFLKIAAPPPIERYINNQVMINTGIGIRINLQNPGG